MSQTKGIIVEQKSGVDQGGRILLPYYGFMKAAVGVKVNAFGRLVWLMDPEELKMSEDPTVEHRN